MTRKQEIIVAIRDTTYGLVNSFISLIRIAVLSRRPSRLRETDELPAEAVILGNGPSLGDFIRTHEQFLHNKTRICVNHFAISEEYEKVKPQVYLISAPEFFLKDEFEPYAKRKQVTWDAIASKTNWPMLVYAPMFAKSLSGWQARFKSHKHISIRYFNNTPVEGLNAVNLWAMKRQLAMPRPHNVVIPCIAVAIFIQRKKLYLVGVEHSWLQELIVDDENEVLLTHKHFYDKQAAKVHEGPKPETPIPMFKGIKMEKRKLHEVLEKFYLSFKSYWEIKPYAEQQGVEIINITSGSYIDAFEKQSIPTSTPEDKINP